MMTTEEQIIAVAEWQGFGRPSPLGYHDGPPEYATDLNAIDEAVWNLRKVGNQFQWLEYLERLFAVVWQRDLRPGDEIDICSGQAFDVINAKANQRLEALCRTLWPERWKE